MSATRSTRLLIVGVALLALISLMLISVDPEVQYTVDEIMESPSDFEDEEVHLRGIVMEGSVDDVNKVFILSGTEAQIFRRYFLCRITRWFCRRLCYCS